MFLLDIVPAAIAIFMYIAGWGMFHMNSLLNKWFTKKRKIKFEFCQNNLDKFLDEDSFKLFQEFSNDEKVVIKEYKCLSQCEMCEKKPYAKWDGNIIDAEHPLELLNKLRAIN